LSFLSEIIKKLSQILHQFQTSAYIFMKFATKKIRSKMDQHKNEQHQKGP